MFILLCFCGKQSWIMELLCREWQGVNVCNFHFSVMFDLGGSISSALCTRGEPEQRSCGHNWHPSYRETIKQQVQPSLVVTIAGSLLEVRTNIGQVQKKRCQSCKRKLQFWTSSSIRRTLYHHYRQIHVLKYWNTTVKIIIPHKNCVDDIRIFIVMSSRYNLTL